MMNDSPSHKAGVLLGIVVCFCIAVLLVTGTTWIVERVLG